MSPPLWLTAGKTSPSIAPSVSGVDRLRAEFNTNTFSGRVESGYRFVTPWLGGIGLTPYAAAQVTSFGLPAYAESVVSGANTFALSYNAKTTTAPRSELGFRTDKSFALADGIFTLRGRAAWAHDYWQDVTIDRTVTVSGVDRLRAEFNANTFSGR